MLTLEQGTDTVHEAGLQLAAQVMPIYEYAERTDPYAIIICDRDARPLGAAIEEIRNHTDGLPSVEDRIIYKRISKRVPTADLTEHLRDPLESFQSEAKGSRIMVVDDYVSNGAGTMCLFNSVCRKLGVDMKVDWVTLAGKGTAYNVFPYAGPSVAVPWRDRPDILGIEYEGTVLQERPTELSEVFYKAVHEGVRQLLAA